MAKKKMPRRIVLTGGGTAGHVIPALALVPKLRQLGFECSFVGNSILERRLAEDAGVKFYAIQAGKLRRYWSFKNFSDVFRVCAGFLQSVALMARLRPDIVFSKGGFVTVPVCLAAWLFGIKIVAHESDLSPGLATRIVSRFAVKILCSFEETLKYLSASKAVYVGSPIRSEIFSGRAEAGLRWMGFQVEEQDPILVVMGGSLGAQRINEAIWSNLERLLAKYRIVHITGANKGRVIDHPRYRSAEFLTRELPDVLAAADLVVSRAGANAIFELLALKKPMLLIPLEVGSRGDQIQNADSFAAKGWAIQFSERDLSPERFEQAIEDLAKEKAKIIAKQERAKLASAVDKICEILSQLI